MTFHLNALITKHVIEAVEDLVGFSSKTAVFMSILYAKLSQLAVA